MNPKTIKIIIYLLFFLFPSLTIFAEEIGEDVKNIIDEKLTSLNKIIAKATKYTEYSEIQVAKQLLNQALQLRKEIESRIQNNLYNQKTLEDISKALNLAKKSINLIIVKELIPNKLAKIKETLDKFKMEVDQSSNEKAKSLYQKACQSQSLAYNSYQELEYNLSLKYLKEASNLTKEMINTLRVKEYVQEKLTQIAKLIESNYKEVLASKNKGALYFIKKAKYLKEEASSLMENKEYNKSLEVISEIRNCIDKAQALSKGKKIEYFDSGEILKELKYLEIIYAQAEEKIINSQDVQIKKIFHQAEVLKKGIPSKIDENLLEKAYQDLYQCNYLISKALHLLKKESKVFLSIEDKIKKYQNDISATETLVRESGEEEAFVILWQAKELYTKAEINLGKGESSKALTDLEEISSLISKAAYIAENSIKLTKKLNGRISHLERLIYKVEDFLKEELDKEIAEETKDLLWRAKESRMRANISLARGEKEKALYNINEGLKHAQKALSNINRGNLLDIEETIQLELIRLENLISKAEKGINESNNSKIKEALVDAKKMELMALKFFQEKDYRRTLESIRKASNLAYKAMGIEGEEKAHSNVLAAEMDQLDKVLMDAQNINEEIRNKEAKELLDKAIELHKNAFISLYVTEDYNQAKKEIEEALKYGFLSIEKAKEGKEEDISHIAQKQLQEGKELIEEAKDKVVSTKNKEARNVLNLSEKYFNKAADCFKNKDFQKTIDNIEAAKSFAIEAIKLAQE